MTTLNSEEITLSSDTVTLGSISAFESQWQHWTVKRSLCPLPVLNRWYISPLSVNDNIEQWRDHSVLCYCWQGEWGVYLPLSLNDNIEQWRDHSVLCQCWIGDISAFESQWQYWTVKRSLCPLLLLTGGVGGISAFESQWQHWTVKRSLCPLIVLPGGYICLWVSMKTLNSEEITLSSDTVEWGGGNCHCWLLDVSSNVKLQCLTTRCQ